MAYRAAVKKGPRILTYNGKEYAAYAMTKDELDCEIYSPSGYNTDTGSAWLKQIFRWQKFGAFTFPEFVVKDPTQKDWWVAFRNISDSEKFHLDSFAIEHKCERVLGGTA